MTLSVRGLEQFAHQAENGLIDNGLWNWKKAGRESIVKNRPLCLAVKQSQYGPERLSEEKTRAGILQHIDTIAIISWYLIMCTPTSAPMENVSGDFVDAPKMVQAEWPYSIVVDTVKTEATAMT
jgi:hypothetical protein